MSGRSDRSRSDFILPSEVWVIFSIAVILRLAFFFHLHSIGTPIHHDGELYLALAEGMRNGVFSMFHPLDIPETTRMPGYAFLVKLFASQNALLLFQAIISAGKIPLFFLILRELKLRDPRIALCAMLLLAIEPIDIILSGSLLTESLSSFLLLLAVLFLLRSRQWKDLIFAGIALAAMAYLRPNGMHLGILASLFLLLRPLFPAIRAAGLIVMLIVLMLPWIIRNHAIDGRTHISDSGNVVASHFHVPAVLSRTDPALAAEYKNELRELAGTTNWTDRESFKSYFGTIGEKVRSTFLEHPIDWSIVQIEKAARILIAPGRGHISMFFGGSPIAYNAVLILSILFSILILAILSMAVLRIKELEWQHWLLIAIIFFLIFSAAISTADARFKDPALPLILLLGASLLDRWSSTDRVGAQVSRSS